MSAPNIFTLSHESGKITITTDPAIAKDLIYVLSTLLDLSHAIRTKITFARALEAATDEKDVRRRQEEFKRKSSEVFSRFQEHLNNGCAGNKAAALQCVKKDFGLGYGEAKIYVTEGRRLNKANKATVRKA